MRGLLERARMDKNVAMAIVGQAIVDEGYIGADGTIVVAYSSQENARHLWEVANAWGLVHPLRTKIYKTHTMWCVSFDAEKREEIYLEIGPLPDPEQDKMFRHVLRDANSGKTRGGRGETRIKVLELLKDKAMTVREIAYGLDLSASTVRRHLRNLEKEEKAIIIGYNKASENKNQRTAKVWSSNPKL
ncbi:MAG: winged helix-turn-helix transcriptional regulator [Methanophagales archaeon]|nr:winged helix-turn-helix transcriptional regulator [Methanophagales archaeon]